jgi:hypothetical protein
MAEGRGAQSEVGQTQSDLVSCISATRESVNVVLNTFRNLGFIHLEGHMVTHPHPG